MSGTSYGYDAPRSTLYRPRGAEDERQDLACPPGWCRASGRWQELAGRGEGPWGFDLPAPRARPRPIDPGARDAAVKAVFPQLQDLVKAAAKHPQGLDSEEEELLEAIKDWVGRLYVETLK